MLSDDYLTTTQVRQWTRVRMESFQDSDSDSDLDQLDSDSVDSTTPLQVMHQLLAGIVVGEVRRRPFVREGSKLSSRVSS